MAFKIPNFYSTSPLHGSYYNPKGETYISEVGMIQDAANAVSRAAMDIENASAESKANRQEKRVEKRVKRRGKKGNFTEESLAEFDAKTQKISDKAKANRDLADVEKTQADDEQLLSMLKSGIITKEEYKNLTS